MFTKVDYVNGVTRKKVFFFKLTNVFLNSAYFGGGIAAVIGIYVRYTISVFLSYYILP